MICPGRKKPANLHHQTSKQVRRIVICSGKVNRYGYKVLAEGINLEHYLKNPIILAYHEERKLSIGKMNDIKLELDDDGRYILTGEPEFDEADEFAVKIKNKYEKGYLNACSIGFDPIETTEEPEMLDAGQRYSTVTKSELLEISMTNIPGDRDAVGASLKLSAQGAHEVVLKTLSNIQNQKVMDFKKVALKLGLPETATEDEVLRKVETLQLQLSNLESEKVEALVKLGKEAGFVTEASEGAFRTMAKLDYESANKLVLSAPVKKTDEEEVPAAKKGVESVVETIKKLSADGKDKKTGEEEMTFEKLSKDNPKELMRIKNEEPERYKKLVLGYTSSFEDFIVK